MEPGDGLRQLEGEARERSGELREKTPKRVDVALLGSDGANGDP